MENKKLKEKVFMIINDENKIIENDYEEEDINIRLVQIKKKDFLRGE